MAPIVVYPSNQIKRDVGLRTSFGFLSFSFLFDQFNMATVIIGRMVGMVGMVGGVIRNKKGQMRRGMKNVNIPNKRYETSMS